jgi:hypothetical protein
MTTEKFANVSQTALGAVFTIADPTMTVQNGALLPTSGDFHILVDAEIFLVTSIAGNVLTITAGAEGTTPANHTNGTTVTAVLTKAAFEKFVQREESDPFPVYLTQIEGNALYALINHQHGGQWLRDGEDGDSWPIPGPPGSTGATGATGATGPAGPTSQAIPGRDGDDADYNWLLGPPGGVAVAGSSVQTRAFAFYMGG